MLKATSYSWISVRAFNYYLARQVEQRRLEWTDIPAIQAFRSAHGRGQFQPSLVTSTVELKCRWRLT